MKIEKLKPKKALNKAFLKVKPNRIEIEHFKANLIQLLDRTNDTESEEFHKNLVSDFLKKTYYDPNHFINTKGRNDLVIHNGDKAKSSVGVILEAKKPTNKWEMVRPPAAGDTPEQRMVKLNVKAFHELVLYYLRERITEKNPEVKHLVITNINEWFIFDANTFDRLFAQNKNLVKQFRDFEGGRLAGIKTDFFYKEIAEPFIADIKTEIEFTYFNLLDYQKPLRNENKQDDNELISLFKLLSPEHLLKLPFANDSNTLDKRFYSEMLHIIGLNETKEGSKKLIGRNKEDLRNSGSILEDAMIQLDSLDKIGRLEKPRQFGETHQERLFNVALELSITWLNRILFLKLLEAQLITYHDSPRSSGKGDESYAFLNIKKVKSYDDLNSLFFQVLARKSDERNPDVKKVFEKVPYLNSSLFEPMEIEQVTLFISNLRDDKTIPILPSTVLKDEHGKKRTGSLNTLEYLFAFLSAYDFSSEGSEKIQEENKTLINASVLGLIFEKINGYKDGSFFTPGFITMYMCRETIRKAVVQKFNETKHWNCKNLDDLYDKIDDRREANEIVNSIKICDPAVGSGHFLVSALNEIIAVKNDLRILQDRDGKRLKEYQVEVVNDELIVTDDDGELFGYNPKSKESQRIQEALFHEKQTIIENCLFGVDINSNSVKICRLRLWIELLKSAYYKNATELETLPNIDINIKCGNSLVSRFALDADLKQALKSSRWSIDSYRIAVATYRNAQNKTQKRAMERLIADIKSDFRSEISRNDPKIKKLNKLSGELFQMSTQHQLFEMSDKEKADWNLKVETLTQQIKKLEAEIEAIKANKIYENAFEWRFEFPEVLNEGGDFIGFDVVIGNPPYIRQEEIKEQKPYFKAQFKLYTGTADVYIFFIEKGFALLKDKGVFTFIMPNKFMQSGYGKPARNFLLKQNLIEIIDFGDFQVFDEATTYPCILMASKESAKGAFRTAKINTPNFITNFPAYVSNVANTIKHNSLSDETWVVSNAQDQGLLQKAILKGKKLEDYVEEGAKRGVLTGLTEAFVIDEATKDRLIKEDYKAESLIKPFVLGRNIKPYSGVEISYWLILVPKGFTIRRNLEVDNKYYLSEPTPRYGTMEYDDAWGWFYSNYPSIARYLLNHRSKAEKRTDKGDFWWELRSCDYYDKFENPKIMYQVLQVKPCFIYDEEGLYCNNSMWFIPSDDKVLLGILNSKMGWWLISKYCTAIQNGYQLIWKYFSQIPIAIENGEIKKKVEVLVDMILETKKHNPSADTTALEAQIDQLVYQLYELTEEEIEIIENA
ncbi:MAG: class I SAM-dependent DNA methyltransferase [Bacteroidales bacterium]|nr:class I SAM-dependent DNA methyltransferase [Bacteroidales bacterium]